MRPPPASLPFLPLLISQLYHFLHYQVLGSSTSRCQSQFSYNFIELLKSLNFQGPKFSKKYFPSSGKEKDLLLIHFQLIELCFCKYMVLNERCVCEYYRQGKFKFILLTSTVKVLNHVILSLRTGILMLQLGWPVC